MAHTDVYEKLAAHLDQHIIGAPMSPSFRGILEILFPGEEAEVALKIPFAKKTMAELKEMIPEFADNLDEIIPRMVKRGVLFTLQKPGKERTYQVLPTVVGFAETPFWAGKDTPETRKLAPLWMKYRNEAFGAELARGLPVMRVIPVGRSLKNDAEILPYDVIAPKIERQSYCAVGNCPCRQMARIADPENACGHSLENCMHFGAMGRYMVEQGMAREITKQEALDILMAADEEGLVHSVENMENHLSTICNCCGCCCVFLDTQKKMNLYLMSRSNYVSVVDAEDCMACGACVERCPMDAIALPEDGTAFVDPDKCIGCGVCVPTCPGEAIGLVLRAEVVDPPKAEEMFMARMAGKV